MKSKKCGAFQLSIGFIITIVFAVVLLSLGLTWLRGTIGGITTLTDDLTQQAQSSLRDTFRQTTNNFAIWPNEYELQRGKEVKFSAGIENDAVDGKTHKYVINVIPVSASDNICKGGDISKCPQVKKQMEKWLTYYSGIKAVTASHMDYVPITIHPDSNAKKGTYMFHVVCCYDMNGKEPSSDRCLSDSDNIWGGSAQTFVLSIV